MDGAEPQLPRLRRQAVGWAQDLAQPWIAGRIRGRIVPQRAQHHDLVEPVAVVAQPADRVSQLCRLILPPRDRDELRIGAVVRSAEAAVARHHVAQLVHNRADTWQVPAVDCQDEGDQTWDPLRQQVAAVAGLVNGLPFKVAEQQHPATLQTVLHQEVEHVEERLAGQVLDLVDYQEVGRLALAMVEQRLDCQVGQLLVPELLPAPDRRLAAAQAQCLLVEGGDLESGDARHVLLEPLTEAAIETEQAGPVNRTARLCCMLSSASYCSSMKAASCAWRARRISPGTMAASNFGRRMAAIRLAVASSGPTPS